MSPKTKESIREELFGPFLMAVLTAHMEQSRHIGLEDFVFCGVDGGPLNPDVLRKDVLYPILDRLQIPRSKRSSGFHGFRHSGASIVNDKTGNLKLTQRFLGHADLSTTADRYTHVFDESRRAAAVALERAIFGESVPHCSPKKEQEV